MPTSIRVGQRKTPTPHEGEQAVKVSLNNDMTKIRRELVAV
jgi:hypothetical protein